MKDDLISRQAAIDALKNISDPYVPHPGNDIYWCVKAIEELPSVEPVGNSEQLRPKGKWEYEKINSYSERTYCSECGSHAPFEYVTDDHYGRHAHGEIWKTNYCPNCGALMEGAKE